VPWPRAQQRVCGVVRLLRAHDQDHFESRCLAGTAKTRLRIRKEAAGPVWQAAQEQAVVVWGPAGDPPPAWMVGLGPDVREIACFPFGQPDRDVVDIIGVGRRAISSVSA